MDTQEILQALQILDGHFPREAVEEAIAQRETITPHLLETLEDAQHTLDRLVAEEDYMFPLYAFFLLAQFREERAYPLIADFFSIPGDAVMAALGDFVTESLGSVLASVSGGDTSLMKRMVEDSHLNEYVRSSALQALLVLVTEDVTPADEVKEYFRTLFLGGLERKPSFVWDGLVDKASRLCAVDLEPEIERAFDEGLTDQGFADLEWVREMLFRSEPEARADLREDAHCRFVHDTVAQLEWWACFNPKPVKPLPHAIPAPSPMPKVGRNDPCPCGSGRKYKHCHGKR